MTSLPPASLPLRFELSHNARPTSSSSLTPCLKTTFNGVSIYRILDAEYREPYVSAGRIFAAVQMTPLAGLFRFGLQPGDWDLNLAGLAPFDDIWVSLSTARHVAESLDCSEQLYGLIDWKSRFAWTLLDREENALRHNWRIPPNSLAEDKYSTSAMLETAFPTVVMLSKNQDVRTHIPTSDSNFRESSLTWETQWNLLIRWALLLYEEQLDRSAASDPAQSPLASPQLAALTMDPSLIRNTETHLTDALPSFVWALLSNQLQLVNPLLASTFKEKGRAWTFAGGHITARKVDRDLVSQLALCDAMANLALVEWHRVIGQTSKEMVPEPAPTQRDLRAEFSEVSSRIDQLREDFESFAYSTENALQEVKEQKAPEAPENLAAELLKDLRSDRAHSSEPEIRPETLKHTMSAMLVTMSVAIIFLGANVRSVLLRCLAGMLNLADSQGEMAITMMHCH